MTRKFLAFDIETAKPLPGDFSKWRNHRPLGICCAATVAEDSEQARVWHGKADDGRPAPRMSATELAKLVNYLAEMAGQGYEIVTWNGLQFDFDVLAEESKLPNQCQELARQHVDMMFHVVCQLGHFLSLEAAAKGMKIQGKSDGMSGQMAPQMWERGEYEKVLAYVEQDARCTIELATSAESSKRLRWISQKGKPKNMPMPDGWLKIDEALKLPLPDTSWMTHPIKRKSFMRWIS